MLAERLKARKDEPLAVALERLLAHNSNAAPPAAAVDPLAAAETAAEIGEARRDEVAPLLARVVGDASEAQLAAVARAYEAQRERRTLASLVDARCGGSAFAALVNGRLRRALAAPAASRAAVSTPEAAQRARQLHAAGKGIWCGTDEDVFIELIGFADAAAARALRYEYAMRFGHTLASAVRDEMGGRLEDLLLAFLDPPEPAPPPPTAAGAAERARELHTAVEGLGIDGAAFVRVLGGCSAPALAKILEAYESRYGKPLVERLRTEFVFDPDLRKLVVTRCKWARATAATPALGSPAAARRGGAATPATVAVPGSSFETPATAARGPQSPPRAPRSYAADATAHERSLLPKAAEADLLAALPQLAAISATPARHRGPPALDATAAQQRAVAVLAAGAFSAERASALDGAAHALGVAGGLAQLVQLAAPLSVQSILLGRLRPPAGAADALRAAEDAAELADCSRDRIVELLKESPRAQLVATLRAFRRQQNGGLASAANTRKRMREDAERATLEALCAAAEASGEAADTAFRSDPLAAQRARQLHAAGKGIWCGTDEDVFIELIGFADAAAARALRYEYAMRFGHTLASAVRDEMGGRLEDLLLAFLDPPEPAPPPPTAPAPPSARGSCTPPSRP